jgi:hypothetical protein
MKDASEYLNPEFISYLREHDSEAEIIEISDISLIHPIFYVVCVFPASYG